MKYTPKKEPWAHQKKALELMEGKDAYGLLMAMRTGKTKTVLDDFGRLWANGQVDDLLVIAPAGVYRTWETAIKEHLSDEVLDHDLWTFVWESGNGSTPAKKLKLKGFLNHEGPRVFLVNVEALSTVKRAKELVLEFCCQRRVYAVVDESTSIKNYKSKRTKFVLELAPLCKFRRILTGLVSPKEPSDVWSQFEFLRPGCLGFSNFYSFQARYAITKIGYGKGSKPGSTQNFIKITGWRDQEELRERIARHSFRVKLSDCYDLPPKIYQVREVELTDEQERVYGELQKYATAQLKEDVHVTALQACTLALRLHQICCGHVGDEEGNRREVESNRVKELMNLLEEWDDQESKAIIWCAYDQDVRNVVDALEKKFGHGSVARFWGGNRSSREIEERIFKESIICRFMVATAAAGGRGRTWDVADLVVYFSSSQDLEHREQSEERPQAVGREKSILYIDLMSVHKDGSHTIDYAYLESLRRKISMAALLQGDGFRRWVI